MRKAYKILQFPDVRIGSRCSFNLEVKVRYFQFDYVEQITNRSRRNILNKFNEKVE